MPRIKFDTIHLSTKTYHNYNERTTVDNYLKMYFTSISIDIRANIKYRYENKFGMCQINLTCDNFILVFLNFVMTKPIVKPIKYGKLRM